MSVELTRADLSLCDGRGVDLCANQRAAVQPGHVAKKNHRGQRLIGGNDGTLWELPFSVSFFLTLTFYADISVLIDMC